MVCGGSRQRERLGRRGGRDTSGSTLGRFTSGSTLGRYLGQRPWQSRAAPLDSETWRSSGSTLGRYLGSTLGRFTSGNTLGRYLGHRPWQSRAAPLNSETWRSSGNALGRYLGQHPQRPRAAPSADTSGRAHRRRAHAALKTRRRGRELKLKTTHVWPPFIIFP